MGMIYYSFRAMPILDLPFGLVEELLPISSKTDSWKWKPILIQTQMVITALFSSKPVALTLCKITNLQLIRIFTKK